jgi:hypothetical protein
MTVHDEHIEPGNGLSVLAAILVSIALALGALFVYLVPSAPYAFDAGDRCAAVAGGNSKSTGWSFLPPGAKCVAIAGGAKRDYIVGPSAAIGWLSLALAMSAIAAMGYAVWTGSRAPVEPLAPTNA